MASTHKDWGAMSRRQLLDEVRRMADAWWEQRQEDYAELVEERDRAERAEEENERLREDVDGGAEWLKRLINDESDTYAELYRQRERAERAEARLAEAERLLAPYAKKQCAGVLRREPLCPEFNPEHPCFSCKARAFLDREEADDG